MAAKETYGMVQDRLQLLYRNLNESHFGGRLPAGMKIRVTSAKRYLEGGVAGLYEPWTQRITLHPHSAKLPEGLRGVLLHEMAHVADAEHRCSEGSLAYRDLVKAREYDRVILARRSSALNDHSKGWQEEMRRLARDHGETWALRHVEECHKREEPRAGGEKSPWGLVC